MDHSALSIYQAVLDDLSSAVFDIDTDEVAARVRLPVLRRTIHFETLIETRADLHEALIAFGQPIRAQGVNQFIRLAGEARFLSPVYIEGHHVTHLMRDGATVIPSFSTRMVLMQVSGVWKIAEIDSAVADPHWDLPQKRPVDTDAPLIEARLSEADVRCGAANPLALYQGFLDSFSLSIINDDFDEYCGHCAFPMTSHTNAGDQHVAGPEDTRHFFDMLRGLISEYRVGRLDRRATGAEFIAADRICGYHTTRLYAGSKVAVGPILSRYILRRDGARWKLISVTNSVADHDYPYEPLKRTNALMTLKEIQERMRR